MAFHIIRPIERVRLLHGVTAVAGEAIKAEAIGQYALIGGHPFNAIVGHHADDLLGDGAFGRPHATRGTAEQLLIQGHAAPHLLLCICPKYKAIGHF